MAPRCLLALLLLGAAGEFVPRDSAHCLTWHSRNATPAAAPGLGLCRRRPAGGGRLASSFDDVGRWDAHEPLPLPVGAFDRRTGSCLIAGSADETAADIEVAVSADNCDVWWRHVSEDVLPPMTELALQFGTSVAQRGAAADAEAPLLLGVCRSLDTSAMLGTLVMNGRR